MFYIFQIHTDLFFFSCFLTVIYRRKWSGQGLGSVSCRGGIWSRAHSNLYKVASVVSQHKLHQTLFNRQVDFIWGYCGRSGGKDWGLPAKVGRVLAAGRAVETHQGIVAGRQLNGMCSARDLLLSFQMSSVVRPSGCVFADWCPWKLGSCPPTDTGGQAWSPGMITCRRDAPRALRKTEEEEQRLLRDLHLEGTKK